MKKYSTFFLAMLLSFGAFPQTPSFEIGFEGGPSLSWLRGNNYLQNNGSPRVAAELGLALQYNINTVLSVRMAPGYALKGTKIAVRFTDETGMPVGEKNLFTNLHYFSLPLLLRASFGNKIKGFVNAGPYMGSLINSNAHSAMSSGVHWGISEYKSFDYGIASGLGILVPLGNKCNLTVEGRHNIGLFNISNVRVTNDASIKTNSLVFLLGCAWKVAG